MSQKTRANRSTKVDEAKRDTPSKHNARDEVNQDDSEPTLRDIMSELNFMKKDIRHLTTNSDNHSSTINKHFERISYMENLLQEKDKRIEQLQDRIEDLEQYTRKEDVIVTGLTIKKVVCGYDQGRNHGTGSDRRE